MPKAKKAAAALAKEPKARTKADNDAIHDYLTEQSGKKFDPKLVQLLFDNWDTVEDIRARMPD